MKTRAYIATLLAMMISVVLFGSAAVAITSVPALKAEAAYWFPAAGVASILIASIIGWFMAPRLRARYWREREESQTTSGTR